MKKIFVAAAVSLLFSCSKNDSSESSFNFSLSKKGTKPVSEREVRGSFDEIFVSNAISADIIKSDEEKVIVSAPADLQEYIVAEITNGKLTVAVKGTNVQLEKVKVRIFAKDFDELHASSAADVDIKDRFTQNKTKVSASSSASVNGYLEANDLEISATSSGSFSGKVWAVNLDCDSGSGGSIDIHGKTKNADVDCSSGSSFEAPKLMAAHVKADASSGSSVKIGASESLEAESSSGGSITVNKNGDLKPLEISESSGGSVTVL